MIVEVSPGLATASDIDNLRALAIRSSLPADEIARIVPGARADGNHVWLPQSWLAAQGRPADADWQSGFARMIAYAAGAGWVDEAGAVRAHIDPG